MRKQITRKYYQTAAEAKLVRKSFLGVSPNTWSLETYLFQSSSDLQYFCTIGENCIPVELLKTSTKIPQPGNPFCLSYDWVSVEHVLYKRIEWIILKYEYYFYFHKDGQYMWMFYNITMGIKDRSVFTPPKFCFQKVNVYFFLGKVCDFS